MACKSYRVLNARGERVGTVTGLGKTAKDAERAVRGLMRKLRGAQKSNPRRYKTPTSRRKAARARKRLGRAKAKRLRKLWGT